jgi:hypothetical protein
MALGIDSTFRVAPLPLEQSRTISPRKRRFMVVIAPYETGARKPLLFRGGMKRVAGMAMKGATWRIRISKSPKNDAPLSSRCRKG